MMALFYISRCVSLYLQGYFLFVSVHLNLDWLPQRYIFQILAPLQARSLLWAKPDTTARCQYRMRPRKEGTRSSAVSWLAPARKSGVIVCRSKVTFSIPTVLSVSSIFAFSHENSMLRAKSLARKLLFFMGFLGDFSDVFSHWLVYTLCY